ncbi:MAG TPA: sugar transferase [Acidobacteriota bacterium]|jgi:exopolysaccharide biosynthesis polyprenyl glycosylphosphotransferase
MIEAGRYKKLRIFLTLLGDIVVVALAYVLAFYLRATIRLPLVQDYMPFERFFEVRHYWWVLFGTQVGLLYFFGLYDVVHQGQKREALIQIPLALFIQVLLLVSFYFFKGFSAVQSAGRQELYPRTVFIFFYFMNCVLVYGWRLLIFRFLARPAYKRVLLYGVGKTAREFIRNVEANPFLGLKVVGLVEDTPSSEAGNGPGPAVGEVSGYPVLGRKDDLVKVVEQQQVDAIIMTPTRSWQDELIEAVSRSEQTNANIFVVPSVFEMLISKMQHLQIQDIPLVEVVKNPTTDARFYTKRVIDIFFSALLLALLSPVFFLVALVIKVSGPGPLIYVQKRVGKDGALFSVYKFRTMVPDAEANTGAILASEDDVRVTQSGKWLRRFRLDELPQLVNILQGDMSFVGPRPERPEFVNNFAELIPGYRERFKMKPGVTGLAQVHGEYHTSPEMKLRYDLAYIYNHNLLMDLMIVLSTIKIMLTRRGV